MIILDSINKKEALRYLGYGNNVPDENIGELIIKCEEEILKVIKPRYLFQSFDIEVNNDVKIKNSKLVLKGNDIKNHLEGCEKAVLICATISGEVDKLIRINQLKDMTKALILDSLASVAIEQVCNEIDKIIREQYSMYNQTWRYSPGYGDFPIEIQKDFLDVLTAQKKIGLMVTESSMLTPRKSVTAVIGLSKNEITKKKRGCQCCNLKDICEYRKRGEHCGF